MRNLVVVVLDTLRSADPWDPAQPAGASQVFGDFSKTTALYNNLVASSSWTVPSHRSLLHGVDPWDARETSQAVGSSQRGTTLARFWAELGGESVALSLNPFVSRATGVLQDYDRILRGWQNRLCELDWRLSGASDALFREVAQSEENSHARKSAALALSSPARAGLDWGARVAVRAGLPLFDTKWLTSSLSGFLRQRTSRRPLLIFLNMMEMHEPYPGTLFHRSPSVEPGCLPTSNLGAHSDRLVSSRNGSTVLRSAYSVAMLRVRSRYNELMTLLQSRGVLGDSLVVATSDHGQALGEHGYFGHGRYLYDELVHIPTAVTSTDPRLNGSLEALREGPLDHRHLHDWILSAVSGQYGRNSVRDVFAERGPAISYVATQEFRRSGPLVGDHASVRLFSESGSAWLESWSGRRTPEVVDLAGSEGSSLLEQGTRVLEQTRTTPGGGIVPDGSLPVARRLQGWGYE